ncbi:MAG: NADPH:quinone reductase [Pseudomonas sp.]|uniref:zinc-dependent alcohol dehydrogenase family protein n=1 Tax=Pseudomonas sp. TaxID=306 RepID=UPI00263827EB|nr:zinc-dependent alcohol dehydrogenase family protein [Pseudomonas sp.]MDB6050216.1 NADPH:quinone reductase [Pseudomonas sp.]
MSRIIQFTTPGGPEVLSFKDIEVGAPGPGEIRIRVKALGLNRAESMWRSGEYVEEVKLPARLGYEAAGIVDAVGPDVTGFAVGDAVNTVPAFSQNQYGMYGELVLAPVSAVVKHPPSLSFEQAASIWMMFITVYGAFIEAANLTAGDVVLIPAASSSVGLAAIQLANMVGATPIALTRTGAKRQRLLDAGAAFVIATEEQDLVAEVMQITEGAGARVVFDPVGGPSFGKLIKAMTTGGMLLVYGALSEEPAQLSYLDLLIKLPTIVGYTIWNTSGDPVRQKAAVEFILAGLASGELKPVIDSTFAFDDMVAAHRYLETNAQFGKIVVTV